jgi:hypothetical protein
MNPLTENPDEPRQPRQDWAVIRPYRSDDRASIRQICCVTAFRNTGARAVFGNEDACADYWTKYYTDVESTLTYVAELDGQVVGYVLGCFDSRRHTSVMARRIAPRVLVRVLRDVAIGRYRDSALRAYLRWAALWSWRETLPVPVADYPSHYHINVVPAGQNQRLYSRLSLAFLEGVEQAGGGNVHGLLTEREQGGPFNRFVTRFSAAHPDARVLRFECRTRFGHDVLGDDRAMVNRAFCFTADDFRGLMQWVAVRYGA